MDASNVSNGSTRDGGLELIADIWATIEMMKLPAERYKNKDIIEMRDKLIFAVHRLTFLEMVTKGLTFMEMHDAAAYAKFVDKKRKIEDMDIDELRVLLR